MKEKLKDLTGGLLWVKIAGASKKADSGSGKFGLGGPLAVRMQEHPRQRNCRNYDKERISYKLLILHF